jgi:hypothetical protein
METDLSGGRAMSVTLEILGGPDYQVDDEGWENHTYLIRLRCDGRYMDTPWHQGLGITDDPTAESVLENMLSSAQGVEYASFEEWAEDYGYDTDSRKAEQTYNAVTAEGGSCAPCSERVTGRGWVSTPTTRRRRELSRKSRG